MSVALMAESWAWRFTQTVKRLTSFQSTGELQLSGTVETGKFLPLANVWFPGTLEIGKSFYCLCEKNIGADLNLWAIYLFYRM